MAMRLRLALMILVLVIGLAAGVVLSMTSASPAAASPVCVTAATTQSCHWEYQGGRWVYVCESPCPPT